MVTIWGRRNSINVQKVMWTVGELGIDYERHNIGGSFGGLDAADYLKMNPMGLVPTVRDGDTVIFESNAIVRYLAARYGAGSLWSEDPAQRAGADQWMEWSANVLNPALTAVFWAIARTPRAKQDLPALKPAIEKLGRTFGVLDRELGTGAQIGGAEPTFGDIPLGAMAWRYLALPIDRPALPNIERWKAGLAERPAYREHIMIPFGTCQEEWTELERKHAEGARSKVS